MSRNGRQVSHVVAGLADKATRQPMQPQDKVYIGSITKTFTATVVLRLAAEGRLSLDDSVQQLLPGVVAGHGYDPARITVRQLLQHTSGIRDYVDAPGFLTPQNLAKTHQPQQLVDIALSLGPPLHGWNYSNANYILLGMIIQKVTGQSPGTEISRRILTPLGLRDISFPLTSTQITAPYAHGYRGTIDATSALNPSATWTAGAIISTVDDVATFYQALLTGRSCCFPRSSANCWPPRPLTIPASCSPSTTGWASTAFSCPAAPRGGMTAEPQRLQDHRLHQPRRLPPGRHDLQQLHDERPAGKRAAGNGRVRARSAERAGDRVLRAAITSNPGTPAPTGKSPGLRRNDHPNLSSSVAGLITECINRLGPGAAAVFCSMFARLSRYHPTATGILRRRNWRCRG